MHTMVVQMSIDPSRTDVVTRHLREDIVGWARQQPGFVSGQWLLGPGQNHGVDIVVFASEDAAATAAGPAQLPARRRPSLKRRGRDRLRAGHLRLTAHPPRRYSGRPVSRSSSARA